MFFKIRDCWNKNRFLNSDHVVEIREREDPDGNMTYEILLSTGDVITIRDDDFKNLIDTPDRFFGSIDQAICTINRS